MVTTGGPGVRPLHEGMTAVTPLKTGGERSVRGRSAAGEGTGDRAATTHRYRRSSPRNH
ncbi:unnamed protein product [Ectocarpus fasciculatus]